MEITLFSVLTIGFILGIKHAIEPDHVIAVSTIASKSKKLWHASLSRSILGDWAYVHSFYYWDHINPNEK